MGGKPKVVKQDPEGDALRAANKATAEAMLSVLVVALQTLQAVLQVFYLQQEIVAVRAF